MRPHNERTLFIASCMALAVTAFMFIIRGYVGEGIQADVSVGGRGMTNEELGWISTMAFWGFASSILVASPILDFLGMKNVLLAACALQVGGLAAFITTDSYEVLKYSMLFAGFGNGLVEAVINPLCATIYHDNKTHKLNVLHAWWPGGLIIGGLVAVFIFGNRFHMSWRAQMGAIIVPAVVYGLLVATQKFPRTERAAAGIPATEMLREVIRPGFLLLMGCMMMTASAELAPGQWVEGVLTDLTKSSGTLVLVYGSGIMFVLRYFAGPIAHAISPIGIMGVSTALTTVGLYLLSGVHTATQAYIYATIFYVGVCFMWPTMLGIAAERFPRGGATTIGLLGFCGQFALGVVIFKIGGWKDLYGSSAAFRLVAYMPAIAFIAFAVWWIRDYLAGGYKAVKLGPSGAQTDTLGPGASS